MFRPLLAIFSTLAFSCFALPRAVSAQEAGLAARFETLKREARPDQLYRFLYALPKGGDLHNHAGGANIPEWIFAVLTDPTRNGGETFFTRARIPAAPDAIAPAAFFHTVREGTFRQLPPERQREYITLTELTPAERLAWANAFRLDAAGEGRQEFFQTIWPRLGDIYRNPYVRTELLAENIKAFAAEGLLYLELQYSALGLSMPDGRRLGDAEAVAFIRERLARPDVASTGLTVRFQETAIRFLPHSEAQVRELYAWISAHQDLWVGLNMAGIEENGKGYPSRFLETFRELRRQYPTLRLSIHGGEMDGPDRNVRDTLLLGATRIGHGVNLIKDPDTLLLLQNGRRVLIEINLISNRLLEYTPDLTVHPFPEYLRTGVPVCLNTDDRGMWDSNMTDEYYTAVTLYNLSWDELVLLGRNSLQYAFVDETTKAELIARYEERLKRFAAEFLSEDPVGNLARADQVAAVTYGYAARTWGFRF